MKKIITGIQPSGKITLGNYIGSIKNIVKLQNECESYIFIADMHAITIPQDSLVLAQNIRNLAAIYLACGIDPTKNTIFLQSDNIYHTNVSWMLECNTYFGELSRMTQFKDKSLKHQNFSAGLLTYPVLMASDILIYDVDYVPVGIDQKQHVELARDIAIRMNKKYGEIFKVPEPLIIKTGAKICDLQDPTKKMSKSSESEKGVIFLLDSDEIIMKKVLSATTDSESIIKFDQENKPGISNLMLIYSSLSGLSIEEVEKKYIDVNYGNFKKDVANLIIETLKPIKERYQELVNSSKLDDILNSGRDKSLEVAKTKYLLLKEKLGLHK